MADGSLDAIVLAIFAAPEALRHDLASRLSADDWRDLASRMRAQRGDTLLRRAVQRIYGDGTTIPAAVLADLDRGFRARTFTVLQQTEALRRIVRILEGEGIVPIALKGVRLAWHTYPAPALRPMRDLDLLVRAEEVEHAQAILLARPDYVSPDWAGRYGIEYGHQLPEIVDRHTGVVIELHHRLNARGWAEEERLLDLMHGTFETILVGGQAVRVPSAHANALHLVEHGTLHHLFDNGPVLLADMHYVSAAGDLDWPLLQEHARDLGLTRALALIGELAARHGAGWPADVGLAGRTAIDPEQLAAAEAALVRDPHGRAQVAFLRRLETRTGTAPGLRAGIRAALSPGAAALAQLAGTAPGDWRRWLSYPSWLVRRIAYFLAARDTDGTGESSRQVRLLEWLRTR